MTPSNEVFSVSFLLGLALKSGAVFLAAWLASVLLRRGSASARHLVWTAAAVAVLILPVLSFTLPSLRVPMNAVLLPGATAAASHAATPAGSGSSTVTARGAMAPSHRLVNWPDWKICLATVWMVGLLAGLVKWLLAYAAMFRVRRRAKPFADRALVLATSHALGIRRKIVVLETAAGSMPMTSGILRPVVLMPADAAQWTEERRRIVLMHEMAHVLRGDVAMLWVTYTALIAYWWNPLAWKAWREFLAEGERATDDLVLAAGARPSDYASHLLDLARSMQREHGLGVAMARPSQLEGRLAAILDSGKNRNPAGLAWGLALAALALALIVPLAAVRAQEESSATLPIDVDAAIRAARSQSNPTILEDAAKAAEQLRKFETEQKLLEAALEIRGDVSGTQSKEYGAALLKLGDLEVRQNNKSAEDSYAKAAQILGDQPEAAPALIHLGTAALAKKDYVHAFDYFERAQIDDPAHAGTAAMWTAITRVREKNPEFHAGESDPPNPEADALFQTAVSLQDPVSPEAVTIMKVYAEFLREQNRPEDAAAMDARAAAALKANARPKPAISAGVQRIVGGTSPPKVAQKVEPGYSTEARLARLQGVVVLQVEIGTDGMAHNPYVSQALGLGLEDRAIDAISQWHFNPAIKDGQPIPVAATIQINFRLL